MQTLISENKSRHIVEEEAMSAIRSIYGITHSTNTILKYAASEMREMATRERLGAKRFDYDTLTYKDKNGDLIDLVCDRIETIDEKTKEALAHKIVNKIIENVCRYYKPEFEDKVEDAKDHYEQFGHFDDTILIG